MVILAGRWEFFDEEKFEGTKTELGPGMYLTVKDHGIKDNSISSLEGIFFRVIVRPGRIY